LIIDKDNQALSIVRQTELLSLPRSSFYYQPTIDPEQIHILHALDQLYTKYPFYGSRRLVFALADEYDIHICRQYVQNLCRLLGLETLYPKKRTTFPAPGHQTYPYLLKNMAIIRPNQVWSTDITYIPLEHGFCYLTVILDWFSRYVIAWELSDTMEMEFCLRALRSALAQAVSEYHNSDQGSQYTADAYTDLLKSKNINISMDGRGRCFDNIFTERLWRTVKYEDIYLKHYRTIEETFAGLQKYFPFYNEKRRHQSLDNKTPIEMYQGKY